MVVFKQLLGFLTRVGMQELKFPPFEFEARQREFGHLVNALIIVNDAIFQRFCLGLEVLAPSLSSGANSKRSLMGNQAFVGEQSNNCRGN